MSLHWYKAIECLPKIKTEVGQIHDCGFEYTKHLIEKSKIFVISDLSLPDKLETKDLDTFEILSQLPFETCWIEFQNTNLSSQEFVLKGFLIDFKKETKEYAFFVLINNELVSVGGKPELVSTYIFTLELLLQKMNTEKTGISKPRTMIKKKINGEKIFHRINEVIYISPKKDSKSFGERNIDWSYRFDIRGHWRNLKPGRLGKTASGELTVGRTWVKPFIKGDEKLPYIKKVRVI